MFLFKIFFQLYRITTTKHDNNENNKFCNDNKSAKTDHSFIEIHMLCMVFEEILRIIELS